MAMKTTYFRVYYGHLNLIGKYRVFDTKKMQPKDVSINHTDVLLLDRVLSLHGDKVDCFMSNHRFSEELRMSETAVSLSISRWKALGAVKTFDGRGKDGTDVPKRYIHPQEERIQELVKMRAQSTAKIIDLIPTKEDVKAAIPLSDSETWYKIDVMILRIMT